MDNNKFKTIENWQKNNRNLSKRYIVYMCVLSHISRVWLCNPMYHSLPSKLVHGIPQTRILEWVAMLSSRGSSQTRDRTRALAGRFFATGATWEAQRYIQFSLVTQSCPTFCNPMDCSTPGLPVHHQLPEFTQFHVQRIGDAIQPSHHLSSPSPPSLNLLQH